MVFTAGSLACALAPTSLALELFRACQGGGGAVLFATGTPLLRAEFSGRSLARALGVFGTTIGAATALGPLVGGALTDTLGWRWIFLINIPIGLAALALGFPKLRESRDPRGGGNDWAGTAAITASLTALVLALIRSSALGWTSPVILALFAVAVTGLAAFIVVENRARQPMVDLGLFTRPSFTATGLVAFTISASVIAVITYLSLYVQDTMGYSPIGAGLRFLPLSLVSFVVAPATGHLIGRIPMRALLGTAMTAAAGLAVMARLQAGSAWTVLLPGLVLAGVGLGVTSTAVSAAALAEVEPGRAGMAAGIVNTLRQVGTATGVAVLGALYAPRAGTASGLNEVLLTAAGVAALGAVAAFTFLRARPTPTGRGLRHYAEGHGVPLTGPGTDNPADVRETSRPHD